MEAFWGALLTKSCCWFDIWSNINVANFIQVCKLTLIIIIIIISAVHVTAGRLPPQLAPCTSILSHSHPLTTTNFLYVVSPFPFRSPSYSFSFSGCPFWCYFGPPGVTHSGYMFCPLSSHAPHSLYYCSTFGDHGSLWMSFNKILHCCPKMPLPDHSSIVALANTFSSFFSNKISVIHSSFPSDSHSRVLNPPDTRKVLQNLCCITADEVRRLVLWAPCKSSELDPIHTSLVKGIVLTF